MKASFNVVGLALVVTLDGELDHLQVERLRGQIDAAYDKSPCKHIVFDMTHVSFMDSSGIGMIIGRYKNAEKRGGQVALANMTDSIARLFEVSGLAKIALRAGSVKDALHALKVDLGGKLYE